MCINITHIYMQRKGDVHVFLASTISVYTECEADTRTFHGLYSHSYTHTYSMLVPRRGTVLINAPPPSSYKRFYLQPTLTEAVHLQPAIEQSHEVRHQLGERYISLCLVQKLTLVSALYVKLHHFEPTCVPVAMTASANSILMTL